ncbi:MAG: DNA polymerase III subunit delta [Candidatus Nealsonbacteria bacterium RBG_13_38_11]|uniref:DNA polymerase III subunit delta n=1 Tax=Candidatus Nealsonbacteria bacterium RBG_13_38_11 TaxID=1801662 RepID=A0A1G2DXV5_9BACT|nr:MAG: DNA polymerase III subunit delta [Candidatus Nealsonbacteria bacterium RBG_13_38_11]
MIILLYGQDTYSSRQKLQEIIESYKKIHKSGLNLIYFDGERLKFEEFKDAFQQASMFDEKKLLVLSNAFSNKELKEQLLANLSIFFNAKDIILFYEEDKILERDKLLKLLKKQAKVQEFPPLEGIKLRNWIKQEFSKLKTEISLEVVDKIIDFVGNDLWQISNEVKKLASFKNGKSIKVEDVELLVKPKVESDIFKTIDMIAAKNRKQALLLIHKHLEKGDNPVYLLSMINFQFRNLLIVKELIEKQRPYYAIAKMTKLHPFVVRKSYEQAVRFSFAELKKIYQQLFEADLAIKTGKMDSEAALDLFLSGI